MSLDNIKLSHCYAYGRWFIRFKYMHKYALYSWFFSEKILGRRKITRIWLFAICMEQVSFNYSTYQRPSVIKKSMKSVTITTHRLLRILDEYGDLRALNLISSTKTFASNNSMKQTQHIHERTLFKLHFLTQ